MSREDSASEQPKPSVSPSAASGSSPDCEESVQELRLELQRTRAEAASAAAHLENATKELVEMAAQLRAEMERNAELEAERIRGAQSDTLAQAAATLRHEINNPLFVICGSAESALRKLRGSATVDPEVAAARIEPVLEAAERIRRVVSRFSVTVEANSSPYLPGMEILKLEPLESEAPVPAPVAKYRCAL